MLRRLHMSSLKKQFRGNEILDVLQCTVSLERKLDYSFPDITLDFVLVFHQQSLNESGMGQVEALC